MNRSNGRERRRTPWSFTPKRRGVQRSSYPPVELVLDEPSVLSAPTREPYDVGDQLRLTAIFRALEDNIWTEVDPENVRVIVREPDGSETIYDAASGVERDATGRYFLAVTAVAPGEWRYRFVAEGQQQPTSRSFFVREAIFVDALE